MIVVMISGGFDPLHDGHIDYIEGAAELGQVIIALNSDEWLDNKKGYVFQPFSVRARILRLLKPVYDVVSVKDSDGTVCEALRSLSPHIFANGGDRTEANPKEHLVCEQLGIIEKFGVGGKNKLWSSHDLARRAANRIYEMEGP